MNKLLATVAAAAILASTAVYAAEEAPASGTEMSAPAKAAPAKTTKKHTAKKSTHKKAKKAAASTTK